MVVCEDTPNSYSSGLFLNNQLPFDSFFLKIEFNAFLVLQKNLICFTCKIQSFLPEKFIMRVYNDVSDS